MLEPGDYALVVQINPDTDPNPYSIVGRYCIGCGYHLFGTPELESAPHLPSFVSTDPGRGRRGVSLAGPHRGVGHAASYAQRYAAAAHSRSRKEAHYMTVIDTAPMRPVNGRQDPLIVIKSHRRTIDPGKRHDAASGVEEAIQRAASTADYSAWLEHTASAGGCVRPVQLLGESHVVSTRTGRIIPPGTPTICRTA